MLDFILSPAYAQAAAPAQPNALIQFAPLVVLFVLFYFLLIRPQMKRTKEHRQMLDKIAKGDEVVTNGGLAGKVTSIGEAYATVEVAEGVNVKVQKASIGSVLPKGTLKTL
jgi:preprotein translocase subunit YajC